MIKKANRVIYLIFILGFVFLSSCSSPDKNVSESSNVEINTESSYTESNNTESNNIESNNIESNNIESNNIEISYTLEDAVKEADPAIIDAAKQAIQNNQKDEPKYYDKVYVDIFEVQDKGNDAWEVRYRAKTKETEKYEMNSYAFVTVEKQSSGDFKGYIINPGGRPIFNGK